MIDVKLLKKYSQSLNVLYVEDDKKLLDSVSLYLNKFFNNVEVAYNGADGLQKYKSGEFDIVITDINMPKMNGLDMSSNIKKINPNQEIIIISAYTETNYFLDAIHLGISDYIIKPIIYEQMNYVLYKITNAMHIHRENINCRENLTLLVEEQTQSIKNNYEKSIKVIVKLVEARDTYIAGHSERVANYSKLIAQEMSLSDENIELVFKAAMLHDIGKITISDSILTKQGKLSSDEQDQIKKHVSVGHRLLLEIPMYDKISFIVSTHHERYDGHGYPNGLKGDEIPLLGKIMIVADAFDAMTTNKIYKENVSYEMAINELKDNSGTQFDPEVVIFASKALSKTIISENINKLLKNNTEDE